MKTTEKRKNDGAGAALQIPGTFGDSIAAAPRTAATPAGRPEAGPGGKANAAAAGPATEYRPAGSLC
jgi:hypothetical protein